MEDFLGGCGWSVKGSNLVKSLSTLAEVMMKVDDTTGLVFGFHGHANHITMISLESVDGSSF